MVTTDPGQAGPSTSEAAGGRPDWRHGPLPEIVGYVGAALVASAGLNLIAQSWDTWPIAVRLALSLAGVAVLYVTAITVTAISGGRTRLPDQVARRRLVGVLASLAAPLVGIATAMTLEWVGLEGDTWPLLPTGAALAAGALAAWWAPGVVPTLAAAGAAFVWLLVFIDTVIAPAEQPVAVAAVSAVATIAWLVIAPRVLTPTVLAEALGVAAFIVLQVSHAFMAFDMPPLLDEISQQRLESAMWFSRIALLVFAVVALAVFARGGSWAWAVGGVIAAGSGALSIAGQALGVIAGLFIAGIILLAVSGVLLVARSRRGGQRATSDPEP